MSKDRDISEFPIPRTVTELETLISMAEILGFQEDVDEFSEQLRALKKKEAKHGRRK